MNVGENSRFVSRKHGGGIARFDVARRKANREREACFLDAWKRGARSAGLRYFTLEGPHSLELVVRRDQLRPNHRAIKYALSQRMARDEGLFLCALYSIYNPDEGLRLARCFYPGFRTWEQIMARLDVERRSILEALFAHYVEW